MILKSYVFLERGAHLASGAEWEPSGAGTKTYMVRKECVDLVMSWCKFSLRGVCAFRERSRVGASRDGYK